MANVIFPKYKEALLSGAANIDLTASTVRVALIDTGTYGYNAADTFITALTGASVVGTAQPIAGTKSVTGGKFTSTNLTVTFTGVTGATVEALIIYIDTGTAGTSRMVAFFDLVSGLTLTPNGGNVTVSFNASGIFDL